MSLNPQSAIANRKSGGWSLRARIVVLLLATLVPLAGLAVSWVLRDTREERAQVEHEVQHLADLVAAQVGQSVAGVQERLAVLARLPAVRAGNPQEVERLFRDLLADAHHLENLGLVAPDGTIIASAAPFPPGPPVSLKDREWLQRVVRWGEPSVGGFQVGRITGNPNVILAHPVLDGSGRVTAVVFAALSLPYVSRAVTWVSSDVSLVWAVVDDQGVVLLHGLPETASGRPLGPLPGMLRAEVVVPGTTWRAVVELPEAVVAARMRATLLRVSITVLLVLAAVTGVALSIGRNIWLPLQDLTASIRRMGAGDTGVVFPVKGASDVVQVAAAFQEVLEARNRRHGELTALLEATRVVASSLDLEQSLQAIVRHATIISRAPAVRLFLLDEDAQVLRWRVGVGLPLDTEEDLVIEVKGSFSGQVATTGEPLAVADTRGDPRLSYPHHARDYGLISYLGVPVKLGGRVLGVLVLNTHAPRTYSDTEISYLSAFADQAAIAIENARLYESLQRELAERQQAEAQLRQIVRAVEQSPASVVITDTQGAIEYVNPKFTQVTGYALAEIRGQNPRVLKSGETPPEEYARLWSTITAGGEWRGEFHNKKKNGDLFWEAASISPVRTPEGVITHFVAVKEDITERKRAEKGLAERTRQLEAVRAVGEEITRELDLRTLLDLIHRRAAELVGAVSGTVFLWDEAVGVLLPEAWHGLGPWVGEVSIRSGEGVAGRVAERREGLIVNDYKTAAIANPLFQARTEITAVLAEPLLYRDCLVGVISLNHEKDGRAFAEEDRQTLQLFAAQAAVAIENARLYAAAEGRAQELQTLREIDKAITSRLELPAVLEAVVAGAMRLLENPFAQILLWEEETQTLRYAAALGPEAERVRNQTFELGRGINGTVALTRQHMILDDYQASPYALPEFPDVVATITTPILFGDRLLGVLHSHTTQPGKRFMSENLRLFQMLASQAAIAIENARLYGAAVRRGAEREALLQANQALTSSLEVNQILETIAQHAATISGVPIVRLFLLEQDTQVLRCRVGVGFPLNAEPDLVIPMGASLSGQVAATGKPLAIADTRGDPRVHFPQHIEPYGVVSYLGLPVKFQDRLFGVLVFNTPTPRAYSEAEITFLTAFAGQAALALQNAELFREEQDRRRQLETVRTVSEELTRELDLRTLLSLITRRATELVGAERGTIFLWDERAGLLIPEAWHGYGEWRGEMRLRLGEGLAGTVAERREGMIVNDYRHWPHAIAMTLERAPITSAIAEPLLYQGRLLGVIALSRQGVEHPFAENDRQRLGLFTSHAAIAMENARLYREVQEHAEALERRVEERTRALKETQVELVQSAKLAAVGTLAAGVAHELNQPLTVIRGYAQGLLAEDSLDAEVKTDLDRIQAQTIRMAKIINHLRDFSRQSRGILEPVVLNEVIEAAFTLVSQQLHLRNIKVVTELDPALPMVRGDRVQLEQVFLNLITNARDAMQPQGGGRLTVTTRRVDWSTGQLVDSSRPIDQSTARPLDASAGWLEAAVADTGPGVPEAIQDRIFDPFFTTKEVGQGTGLGLSISYGIVREHGGEIRAENRPEGGAVFVVRLPLAARQEPGMEHLESGGEP